MNIFICRYRSFLSLFVLSFIWWLTVGCAAVHLRDAQDNFNKAAEIELKALDRSFLMDNPEANPGDAFAALNEYRLAHTLAEQLIGEKSAKLRQDNLLGATYILNAMALWRISDLEGDSPKEGEEPGATGDEKEKQKNQATTTRQNLLAVLNQIENARNKNQIMLGTRDKVLHKALYGFYDHDGGRAENDYAKARLWFISALNRLKQSLDGSVPQQHSIRVYVGSSQLRTIAAWELARYIELKNINEKSKKGQCISNPNSDTCAKLKKERTELLKDEKTIVDETNDTVCALEPFWKKNEAVETSLKKLLAPIGLVSMDTRNCQ